jgi:hypothetical protein
MVDFLDEKRREIGERLRELRPVVAEYQRLEAAVSALDELALGASAPRSRRPANRSTAKRSTRRTGASPKPRGRPKGSGTRSNEALAIVRAAPGIALPEIADKMGIKQNYLYRLLPTLAATGLVTKVGRGWHPTQPDADNPPALP